MNTGCDGAGWCNLDATLATRVQAAITTLAAAHNERKRVAKFDNKIAGKASPQMQRVHQRSNTYWVQEQARQERVVTKLHEKLKGQAEEPVDASPRSRLSKQAKKVKNSQRLRTRPKSRNSQSVSLEPMSKQEVGLAAVEGNLPPF